MLNSEVKAIVEAAIAQAATAVGLPAIAVPLLVDLVETIADAPDYVTAIARAKQNALADAEDAAAEAIAEQLIKHKP